MKEKELDQQAMSIDVLSTAVTLQFYKRVFKYFINDLFATFWNDLVPIPRGQLYHTAQNFFCHNQIVAM